MKNIVLIGMPGSGKTTVAELLEERLAMPMIDLDVYLVDYFSESIEDMFKKSEAYFRKNEAFVCHHLKDKEGHILSCGGGVIKTAGNIEALKENGIVFFLNRTVENIIEDIDTSIRPLLKEGKQRLYDLYAERYEMYKEASDVVVDNNDDIEKTIAFIIETYHRLN